MAEDSCNNAINVLANDTDPDPGDTRTITAVTQPTNGTVAITGAGTGLTYTPGTNFAGTDTFTYTITDAAGLTDTATVTVTVTNIDNDAPVAIDDTKSTNEDTPLSFPATDLSANDPDRHLRRRRVHLHPHRPQLRRHRHLHLHRHRRRRAHQQCRDGHHHRHQHRQRRPRRGQRRRHRR